MPLRIPNAALPLSPPSQRAVTSRLLMRRGLRWSPFSSPSVTPSLKWAPSCSTVPVTLCLLLLFLGRALGQIGAVVTLAGGSSSGRSNGLGTAATFYNPYGITMDAAGNFSLVVRAVVVCWGHCVWVARLPSLKTPKPGRPTWEITSSAASRSPLAP